MTSPLPPPATANVRRATHLGLLRITELVVPCAVLEDGTRLVSHRGVADVLGRARGGKSAAIEDGDLPAFFAPSNVTKGNDSKPFRMENRRGGPPASPIPVRAHRLAESRPDPNAANTSAPSPPPC
jgi:hypothetical protein